MDTRRLNLNDAFRLASVLSKYTDVKNLDPKSDAVDFIGEIVNKISPEEYLACVSLMTNTDIDTIKKQVSIEVLTALIEGFKLNQIVSLLHFYQSLGL